VQLDLARFLEQNLLPSISEPFPPIKKASQNLIRLRVFTLSFSQGCVRDLHLHENVLQKNPCPILTFPGQDRIILLANKKRK
jgi:hypothetical protein